MDEKEEIQLISKSILRHIGFERDTQCSNKAIGRVNTDLNDNPEIIWLTNQEDTGSSYRIIDITGAAVDTAAGNIKTYTKDGKVVYKHQKLGQLLSTQKGHFELKAPGGIQNFFVHNLTKYIPLILSNNSVDAKEVVIEYEDGEILQYRSLLELQIKISVIDSDIASKEETLSKEADHAKIDELTELILSKKKEKEVLQNTLQSFIRSQAELRFQPILDSEQQNIKSSSIFKGSLAINGGPGTGKTTVLIQRIKFLTSRSILEYDNKISSQQLNLLIDQNKSWMFFSPSPLLKQYLQNAMVEEGLSASDDKVKVWEEYKGQLCRQYKIFNTETKKPFLNYKDNSSFFNYSQTNISALLNNIESTIIDYYKTKFSKISNIDISPFKWNVTGKLIQKYLSEQIEINSIDKIISVYYNISENHLKDSIAINNDYLPLIQEIANSFHVKIKNDPERFSIIEKFLKENYTSESTASDDEEELETETFEETSEPNVSFDFDLILNRRLKSICRRNALKIFGDKPKFTKLDNEFISLIPEVNTHTKYEILGQLAFYKKYFERMTKGIEQNILRELPTIYKVFRRTAISNYLSESGNESLKKIMEGQNNRIHAEEQSLLLYSINNIVKKIFKAYSPTFFNSSHPYITAYRQLCKPVIGIDEATDFSLLDLLCIHSLSHYELSAVTFSGDLMQRMTKNGLQSWSDLKMLIPDLKIKDLTISYRQSVTLLNVAQSIYNASTSKRSHFKAYLKSVENEPKPLKIIDEDENIRIAWIADRIVEIYNNYCQMIPSIAIFLCNDDVKPFADKLNESDILSDLGITIKASTEGEILGDRNTIHVFPLKYIKGLEFEAVFFHDLDKMLENTRIKADLLDKYLYVGLSRAALYIGLTGSSIFTGKYSYLNDLFIEGNWKI